MKIIKLKDLVIRDINKEEMPEKIKYDGIIYYYNGKNYFDAPRGMTGNRLDFSFYDFDRKLEILDEEEFEDIEEFNYRTLCLNDELQEQIEVLSSNTAKSYSIIKQLIKNQKKIIEMLKKEGK